VGVENDEEFFVKPPEGSGSEVDLPQRGTDGFEARIGYLVFVRHTFNWEDLALDPRMDEILGAVGL